MNLQSLKLKASTLCAGGTLLVFGGFLTVNLAGCGGGGGGGLTTVPTPRPVGATFRIIQQDGTPSQGGSVTLTGNGQTYNGTADNTGVAVIPGVAPGNYTVTFSPQFRATARRCPRRAVRFLSPVRARRITSWCRAMSAKAPTRLSALFSLTPATERLALARRLRRLSPAAFWFRCAISTILLDRPSSRKSRVPLRRMRRSARGAVIAFRFRPYRASTLFAWKSAPPIITAFKSRASAQPRPLRKVTTRSPTWTCAPT